jgi:hypothetical protein
MCSDVLAGLWNGSLERNRLTLQVSGKLCSFFLGTLNTWKILGMYCEMPSSKSYWRESFRYEYQERRDKAHEAVDDLEKSV